MENGLVRVAALVALAVLAAGCGDKSLSQRTGSAVSGAATDFLSGLGEGVDQKMEMALELDPSMNASGLTVTLGKGRGLASNRASIYVVSNAPFNGTLMAKAQDKDGREIGRATADVELENDDAKYVDFQFDDQMDGNLVRKYLISVR
ncbi:MAG: hypothetical protein LBL59_00495 [Xanthomonadaceae bacterium]|jgi:hypothetical protein|nr:hypothetical protein [Xanthomonadaceae bacterium]